MARYNSALISNTITGAATIGSPYSGAFTQFTGTAPYTVTLPTPVAFPGVTQTFYNATSGTVTLSTPAGNFVGTGSPGTGTVPVYAGNVITIISDGANYVVVSEDGSPLTATTGSFSGNVTINGGSATLSVTSSVVTMAPTASSTIDNIAIGSTTRASGAFTTLTANNAVTLTANTASSGTGTGSLVVTGGVGVSGTVYAGAFNGNLTGTIQTAAQPNITSTGSLTIPGLTINSGAGAGGISIGTDAGRALYQYINFGGSAGGVDYAWQIGRSPNGGVGPADGFYFYDIKANATRLSINGSGNVGIGTPSPNGLLNLKGSNGQLVLTNGNTAGGVKLTATDVNFTANGYLAFEGYANEYGRFDSSGNLLINTTTSPTHATTGIFITGSSNRGVSWSPTSDTHYVRLEPSVIDGITINGYSGVAFARGSRTNSTWAESARFDGSGNLSVGQPSAFGRISAVKSGKATIAGVDTAAYAQGVGGTLDLGGNYRASGDYSAFVRIAAEKTNATNADYGYDMGFYVTTNNGATMGTKALTLASSGNVGIGSATPAGILDVGDNRLSSHTYLRNNGNYGGGGGGQTTLNVIFGGAPIAIINNTGTGQRDGQFRLLDENVTKVNIVANASRGGPTYFNGGNVGIGIADPRTILQVAVPSQNYVSFGNTGYGASDWYGIHVGYCEGGNTYYRKTMLAYESLNDGAARGNLHLLVNTAYGSQSATIADSRLMISGTTGNVGIGKAPSYKLDVDGVIRSGSVELGRVHTDIMKMWRTADLQGYTTQAADGGGISYTWDNGMVLVDSSVGSHNWDIGKINLSPGVYQLVLVWRPSPTAHGWSNFGTNSNGHDMRLQSNAGWGAFDTYLSVSALSLNKDLGYSITYVSGIYTVASQTTYRIGMGTQPYNGGGYKYYVEAAYLMRLN